MSVMTGKWISHYQLLEKLGQGGMGEVYLAEDRKLGRKVALKFLPPAMTADLEASKRFEREAKAAAGLSHSNIVTIYEINEYEGQTFIAMEYVEGESLKDRLWRYCSSQAGGMAEKTSVLHIMPLDDIIAIALQLAEGLEAAHQAGIIHRDIKLQNIMLDKHDRVKILDFGLAKLKGASAITAEVSRIGTIHYMSPEQARADELDQRTDIWSFGVVLYELVTGRLPFGGDNSGIVINAILNSSPVPPSEIRPHLPGSLERIIFKCLRKEPDLRYPTMQPLVSDLRKLEKSLEGEETVTSAVQERKPAAGKDSERRHATVIAAEISGYNDMLVKIGAEETAAAMCNCFEMIGSLVEKYRGTIDKIMANTLTLLFGIPTASENAPHEAVNTAIEIRNRLEQFNREQNLEIPLQIHAGINTGIVIAGAMGAEDKKDYTIMGDTVTLAVQLKDMAGIGEIYAGPLTYKYTKNEFEYKEIKSPAMKGTTAPASVFRLLSTRERVQRPVWGAVRMIDSEMVGREKELDRLKLHVMKAINGQGSIASVISETGIGKSRLIAELKKLEEFSKVTLMEGRALSIGRNLNYHPIIESLKNWAGIKEEDGEIQVLNRLEQEIKQVYPGDAADIFPFVATMMGMKLKGAHAQRVKGIEGEAMEKLILKNLRELMIKCSERRALLFIIEDLHWADISSIELLESLFRLAENHPILFINVLRPNYPETGERLLETVRDRYGKMSSEIYLEPLPDKQCRTLIRNLVTANGLPPSVYTAISQRAEGNPFFIEEVVRTFFDEGALVIEEGTLRITEKIADVEIPETIQDVLMARIDRLDETSRSLLKEAAVIGRYFFFKVLAEVTGAPGEIHDRLHYLKGMQLIRERKRFEEVEYLFNHALVQEVAYESILLKKRKELHVKVAQAIEKVFSSRLSDFYGMLALHYSKGENLEKAEEYLIKAGEEALKAAASIEALNYYQEALNLYLKKTSAAIDREKIAQLEKNIAVALFNKGYYVQAIEHIDKVYALWGKTNRENRWIQRLTLAVNLLKVLKHLYFPTRKPRKPPGKRDNEIAYLAEKKAEALTAVDATRFFMETIGILSMLMTFDIPKIENGVIMFSACSALFSYTGISFKISRRILDYIKNYVDKEDIKCSLVYNHVELLHNFYAGNWRGFEYDETLIHRGLNVGEFFYTLVFTLVSGLLKIEQGKFVRARRLVETLCEIGETYRRELITARKYTLNTKLLLKSRKLVDGLKEAGDGIALLTGIGQNIYCLAVMGMKANIEILLNDFPGAERTLRQAKELIAYEKRVVPSYKSSLLISQFLYDLYMLKEALAAGDKGKIAKNRRGARRSGMAAYKNSLKFAGDQTEVFKLMGIYDWMIGKQKKALDWWRRSIITGEHLGARLELARTYMEVGKRLLEEKSKYRRLDGLQSGEYLARARVLFEEMELEWDLQELTGMM